MSWLIPARYRGPELIDQAGHPREEVERALRDIQWVNRRLSGWHVVRRHLPSLLDRVPAGRPIRALDLGTGSADLPRAMVTWARRRGRSIQVTAVDNNPEVVAFARRECAGEPSVRILQADIFQLPFPPRRFDLVTCSLFLHHFDAGDAVRLLQVMARNAREAILVNDLERHRVAYWAIWLLSRVQRRSRMFRHDAPVSVLRAYRVGELRGLLETAGLGHLEIRRHFPFRLAALGPVGTRHGGAEP